MKDSSFRVSPPLTWVIWVLIMLQRIINSINRMAESNCPAIDEPPKHSREQLIQWATGCMWAGLPGLFHLAWVEYVRLEDRKNSLSYKCILNEGDGISTFQPGDDLYSAQCIDSLNDFLALTKKNWKSCKIEFNPEIATVSYEYWIHKVNQVACELRDCHWMWRVLVQFWLKGSKWF